MSHSFKKNPVYSKITKGQKKIANKKIRKDFPKDIIQKGSLYKKYYSSYNICDYKKYETLIEAILSYNNQEAWLHYATLNEVKKAWNQYFKNK